LVQVIVGAQPTLQGSVTFRGSDVTRIGLAPRARLGIARTFQQSRELSALPVIENVMIAGQRQVGEGPIRAVFARRTWAKQEMLLRSRAETLLEWVGLSDMGAEPAGNLSGGQRRLLDIARALMAEPHLLLLDEPTAGVHPRYVELIAERIRQLPEIGVTALLIAHDMGLLERTCEDVVVMALGRVLTRGPLGTIQRDSEVVQAYLGGPTEFTQEEQRR
jgi:ABC-type branched-subunit amino acid transport system ATPase component